MIQARLNSATEQEPGYGQILAILIRRFPWFLAVFVASIAIAGLVTQKQPRIFKSSMQLQVEPNYQGKKDAKEGLQTQFTDPNVEIDTATQLQLMQSSDLIQKAVDKLKQRYPDITVNEIRSSLALSQIKSKDDDVPTKIFKVDYTALNDPQKPLVVLKAIEEVYLEYNKQQQEQRLKKGLANINEQLQKMGEELRKSNDNLQLFRRTQGVIDPETRVKEIEDSLNNIQQARRETASQFQESTARNKTLQEQLKRTPQNAIVSSRLSNSPRYQAILNEIQKTEIGIEQLRLRLKDEHPDVQKLLEQRTRLSELLQEEVQRTLGPDASARVQASGNTTQQSELVGQVDENLASQLVETQTNLVALSAREQILAQKENELRTELKRFPALLSEFNRLKTQVQLGSDRYQQLVKAEQELRQQLDKGGFEWRPVEQPQEGIFMGPHLQQNLLLGGVAGLLLGGIAAALRESSDNAVRTTAELEKHAALPVLGTAPSLPQSRHKQPTSSKALVQAQTIAHSGVEVLKSSMRYEELDLIYKNIELLNSVTDGKSLAIASALPEFVKTSLALGLAVSAARLHKRVLLVDANLRQPTLHSLVNLPNSEGLSTLLTSDSTLPNDISIPYSGSFHVDILTAGPIPDDPANLLSSPRMGELMSAFESNYDLVIVNSPPVLGLVDAMLTASFCHSVVLVAHLGKITRSELTQATAMLSKLNLIGVVATEEVSSGFSYVPFVKQAKLPRLTASEK